MAHALAADLAPRHLDAALVALDALITDALVLAAIALEILGRTKDLFAEKAVLFRLQRAVIDRFRLRDLAVGPTANLRRRSQGDSDGVKIVDFQHVRNFLRPWPG